jgi:hypothetical protein
MRALRLTLLPLLLLACSEQMPVEPVDDGPAFNFANGPGSPGQSGVYRDAYAGGWGFWLLDRDRQLYAEVYSNPGGHCVAGSAVAHEYQFAADGWEFVAMGQEDFYARVWDARDYMGEPYCAWIAGRQTLAEGRVRFQEVAAGNKDDFMGTGQIARTDGLGDTNLRTVFSWDWPKSGGVIVGIKVHTVHLGPDPRYN